MTEMFNESSRGTPELDTKQPSESSKQIEEYKSPKLSTEFFLKLLDPPACVSKGYCDDCGRCEH